MSISKGGTIWKSSTSTSNRARRVLLIEDSADARAMLRMMLQLAGHVVYDAADGGRGLDLLNAACPDVGIIDLRLPGMDGYEVAKRIREQPNGRDMLLLALTGYDSPGDPERSAEHGFDYHLDGTPTNERCQNECGNPHASHPFYASETDRHVQALASAARAARRSAITSLDHPWLAAPAAAYAAASRAGWRCDTQTTR